VPELLEIHIDRLISKLAKNRKYLKTVVRDVQKLTNKTVIYQPIPL